MRKILLLICLFVSSIAMLAGPVDQETAKQKAIDFAASKMGARAQRSMRATDCGVHTASNRASAARDYLHVFNLDGGGFVIVSGDDRTEEILGYSTTGTFDADKIPDNMRAFLQEYVDGIQALDDVKTTQTPPPTKHDFKHDPQVRRVSSRASKTSISPLLSTLWNQGEPYNLYCPSYNGDRAATGCVATAMAQVMGYHKWPNATTADIPAFSTDTRGFSCSEIPAGTTIDWSNIKNYYGWYYTDSDWKNESYNDTQAAAIAKLMQLCGYSVQMDYYCDDSGQSGARTADCIPALIKYFNYEESTCQWLNRENYSYSDWQDIIYEELAAKRPVLYNGRSAGGGHAFVCDGYDSDDFFHINWGWAGTSNGNFRLRLLNPREQGIGGSSTTDGYGMGQGAGIGIQPNDNISTPYVDKMTVYAFNCSKESFTRSSSAQNFNLSDISYAVWNYTGTTQTFDIGARILDSKGNKVEDLGPMITSYTLNHTYLTWRNSIPAFGANYADGTYKLVLIGRPTGSSNWYVCEDGYGKCLDFVISGNTLSLASPVLECSHDVEGELAANSEITIKLKVKNTGTKGFRSNLYYFVNGSNQTAAGFVDAEPGETDVVEFKYTPTAEGTYTFTFDALDYTFDLIVGEGLPTANLSGSYLYASPDIEYDGNTGSYYVSGASTTAYFSVKNSGNGSFAGKLIVQHLIHNANDDAWYLLQSNTEKEITLAAGGSTTIDGTISHYDDTAYDVYQVKLWYYDDNGYHYIDATPEFEFRDSYVLTVADEGSTPELQYDSNSNTYYINGTSAEFYIDIKNTGSVAYSGQLMIEQAFHRAGGGNSWYYKDYPTYPEYRDFTLAAGETKRISTIVTKSDESDVDGYFARVKYLGDDGNYKLLDRTSNFVFIDANEPRLVFDRIEYAQDFIWDSDAGNYYVEGNQLTADFYASNIGSGDFNGQAVLRYYGHNTSTDSWEQIKDATTHPFYVAAGETNYVRGTIEKDDSHDLYTINWFYIDPTSGDEIFLRRTGDNEFRTKGGSDGINEITIDNPANIYDLRGNKVRSNATTTDGLKPGIYIINGKKVIKK